MTRTVLFLLLTACSTTPDAAPSDGPDPTTVTAPLANVSVDDVAAMPQAERIVVDVRTDGEWAGGHVPGAIHIPLSELEGRMSELEAHRDVEIYAICQSGGRSARAADTLARSGFKVHNVLGGTGAWVAAGHPVE